MKTDDRKKGKPARRPGARRARSSKPRSMRGISPSRASSFSIQPEPVNLKRMLQTLKPHDHLCLIYESTEEWRACVVPFIAMGLKRGEKCIYIVDTNTADEIRKYFGEEGVDVTSAEKSGQLVVLHETEAYTREGSFDPDRMIALLIAEAEKAITEGYPAVRVTGEMTWVLRGHPGSEKLLEYEAKLNRDFFPKYPCLVICQYDRWKFDPEIIKGVIMTHPLLVRGNHIYHNFYYVPPEEFLNRKRAEREVQHWLNNVEREQRIMDTLRESEEKYRSLVERANDGICIIQDGIIEYLNPRLAKMWVSTVEEFIGTTFIKHLDPDNLRKIADLYKRRVSGEDVTPIYEITLIRKDGSKLDVEVNAGVISYKGKPADLVVIRDITERKQAEEKMQHLTLVLRAIRNVNQLIARGADRDRLLKGACENFVNTRGYYTAWIALLDESGKLATAAEAGLGKKFRQMIERLKRGELPHCGRKVLKKTGVVVIEDPASACADCPLAKDYTGRCGMSVRLEYGGKVYGLMTVSAPLGIAVEKEEQELFEEVAGDISFALYSMEQEGKRKLAEEALVGEAIRRRILIEQSRDGIVVLDEKGKVYEANRRFAEMLGYSPEEARQLHVWDWDTQWKREQLLEMVRTVSETGDHFETYHRRKDGTTFDVEISTNGAMFAGQKLVFCVCRDITGRKQAEEALRRSEQNFRDSMENLPLGIRILDKDGKTLYANRALLDMWGYSSIEELEAVPAKQRYTPESYAEHMERVKKGRGENIPLNYEVSIVCSDGQVRHLSASTRALLWNGEKRFQAVYQDITERKQAEGALRRSEEKYRTILSEMQDNYFEVDLAGNLTFFNDSTSNSLGYSAEELMGVSYREFTASEDIKLVYKVFNEVYRANRPNKGFLWKVVRKDGTAGFVEATVSPLRNPKGEIIGFRGVGRDITERKWAEEERGQFEQKAQIASRLASVGEMAAGIAHEINNPLTSVIGYSQLLSGREDIPEDVKMDLKAIDEGAQRVAGIIKRLLTFARQSRPERTLVSINDLITNTLDLRAYHLRTNNIKVTAKLATDLPITTADPAQLQQMFLNIIVNAEAEMRQASGRGKLLVKTEEVNGTIRISFKDNGPGIAKKNLARIFDPFFTTREVGQGTGLGLSICHGIIAEHKGKIWAESKPGRGATFIVELPIVMGSRQLEMAEPPGKKLKKVPKAKMLVVDDEPSTLDFLSRLLTDEGHEVETVSNADEALEMVKNKRYSLILLDIKMPGTSGIELYGRMQKIALSLAERVIFITGDVMGTDTEAFLSKTKAPYITKPFDVHQLKKKIERFLTGD